MNDLYFSFTSQRIRILVVVVILLCLATVFTGCASEKVESAVVQTEQEASSSMLPELSANTDEIQLAQDAPGSVIKEEASPDGAVQEEPEAPTSEVEGIPADEAGATTNERLAVDEGVQVVTAFEAAGELPEGVAADAAGNLYVSLGYPFWFPAEEGFGEIQKITPNGERTTLHAFPGGPAPAGLDLTPFGDLYFAYPNPEDPTTNGVYRLGPDGPPERLSGSENIILANGLALTPRQLYVSDSAMGSVWAIPRNGTAEIWLLHEWLTGCNQDTDPVGANGVAIYKNSVYVASTARGLIVRIPILQDLSAGEPEIVAGNNDCDPEFDELDSMDGIAFDIQGNLYALLVIQNKLVRINLDDGSHEVLLTEEDGLFNPASIVFGENGEDRKYVFLTNFALLGPGPEGNLGPAVLKYHVGIPGLP